MAKFPEPPTRLRVDALTVALPGGTPVWRVYLAGGAYPAAWDGFRHYGPTASRFDHHDPPPALQTKGILYVAREGLTCLAEAFQATRTIDRAARSPWLVGFEFARDVTLLDLTGVWPTKAGASMAINSGPRPRAQRWSRAIHAAYTDVDGLLYNSSMHANKSAIALYERALPAMPSSPTFNRALTDPALLPRLDAAAKRLGYRLV